MRVSQVKIHVSGCYGGVEAAQFVGEFAGSPFLLQLCQHGCGVGS